jgi:hypothetical protein
LIAIELDLLTHAIEVLCCCFPVLNTCLLASLSLTNTTRSALVAAPGAVQWGVLSIAAAIANSAGATLAYTFSASGLEAAAQECMWHFSYNGLAVAFDNLDSHRQGVRTSDGSRSHRGEKNGQDSGSLHLDVVVYVVCVSV